jgi:hypothetical protein
MLQSIVRGKHDMDRNIPVHLGPPSGFTPVHCPHCIALYVEDLLIIVDNDHDLFEIKSLLSSRFDMVDMGVAK